VTAHFEAVANASGLPVMLYDIPGRTGITISAETYRRVAEHDRIVAVKDAVGDLFRGVRIMQETGLSFYSGDDVLNLGWLTHGAAGIVSVVGHVAGDAYASMVADVDRGDLAGALATYRSLVPVVEAVMTTAQGAMTAKAAMQLLGVLPNRNVRLPLVPADDALVAELRAVLDRAGLLEDAR
jgi:4-hydroxy-tetrahydrodipicolinate synthase